MFSVSRLVSRRCHNISTILQLSPAPLRTALAQFTHAAPRKIIHQITSRRCEAVLFPPVLRVWARPMFPHSARSLRRLLSSSGITRLHRYYEAIRLPKSHRSSLPCFGCSDPLSFWKANLGPPGLPCTRTVMHAVVSDPGEASAARPVSAAPMWTSANLTASSFPLNFNIGAPSLQPYGLRPTCLLSYA